MSFEGRPSSASATAATVRSALRLVVVHRWSFLDDKVLDCRNGVMLRLDTDLRKDLGQEPIYKESSLPCSHIISQGSFIVMARMWKSSVSAIWLTS